MEKNLFEWIIFLVKEYGDYFIDGTITTLKISIIGTLLGFILGFLIGVVQSTPVAPQDHLLKKIYYKILKMLCNIFVHVFRGTPMMVQAMVFYYGFRQWGIEITPFMAAIFVILLNTGSYMAETVRGGILSIDKGQFEGGKALGMSHLTIMFSVVLP